MPLQANTTYAWTFSETLSGDSGWMEIATDNTGTNLLGQRLAVPYRFRLVAVDSIYRPAVLMTPSLTPSFYLC